MNAASTLSHADLQALRHARDLLETPGLAMKLANSLGTPLERGFAMLPERWSSRVHEAARLSLERALDVALYSLNRGEPGASFTPATNASHKLAVALSGAAGGAFGLPALTVELPISTVVMLRSIADIARSEGESLMDLDTRLNCLQVFAFGGSSAEDDAVDTSYFAVRAMLGRGFTGSVGSLLERGVLDGAGGPVLSRLLGMLTKRFSVVVSEKLAAQAVPVVGAAGGALVNTVFMGHFQDMAWGHFIIRRLERHYGEALVRQAYEDLQTEPIP